MDAVSYSLASKQAQRIEKFIENPDSTSGIVTVPKTIASGETVTVPAGRVAVLPNVVVDGTLNIDGEVFIPSGSSVDFSNGIKIEGNNIALSIPTSYHLLQGNLSATINANYVEVSSTTTRNYTTSDYIFDSLNNKLYDCISASTSGVLLTNTTYFTSITAGALSINNALIPLAHGVDSNGSKNSIVIANETVTGLTYTAGKNYLYKTEAGYGVKPYKPRYLSSELVRRFAGEQPDYFDGDKNKWFNTDAGSELVLGGDFTSGIGAFYGLSNNGANTPYVLDNTVLTAISGLGTITCASGKTYPVMEAIITVNIGEKVKLKFDKASTTSSFAHSLATSPLVGLTALNLNSLYYYDNTATGAFEYEFTASRTNYYLRLGCSTVTAGQYSKYDNVTCFPTAITPTTEIAESRNYLNHIVHADANGQVAYVEELPKTKYESTVKADRYLGPNAVSLSIAFDLTTTPIAIKGKMFGVKSVIRVSAGVADIYLDDSLKGTELKLDGITNGNQIRIVSITDNKITIETSNSSGTATSYTYTSINGVGE